MSLTRYIETGNIEEIQKNDKKRKIKKRGYYEERH